MLLYVRLFEIMALARGSATLSEDEFLSFLFVAAPRGRNRKARQLKDASG
jgi:hypothetical protein